LYSVLANRSWRNWDKVKRIRKDINIRNKDKNTYVDAYVEALVRNVKQFDFVESHVRFVFLIGRPSEGDGRKSHSSLTTEHPTAQLTNL